jgi:hypothetical protein
MLLRHTPVLPAFVCGLALAASTGTAAQPMSAQELDAWFNGKDAAEVNEGTLRFLATPPAKPVHHHQNRIRITPASLTSGWAELAQCHANMDAVPEAQITFREGHIRNLRVVEARAIKKAWVKGHTVQLLGVDPGARLCLAAQTRALTDSGSGQFRLNSGPYMRKFLDGYYPMQVSLHLEYPANLLGLVNVLPAAQPGFEVSQSKGVVKIETFFEGELRIQVKFQRQP